MSETGPSTFTLDYGRAVLEVDLQLGQAFLRIGQSPINYTRSSDPGRIVSYDSDNKPVLVEYQTIDAGVSFAPDVELGRNLCGQVTQVFEDLGYPVTTKFDRRYCP